MTATAPRLEWQFQLLDLKPSRPKPTLVPSPPPVEPGQSAALSQLRATLDPAVAAKVMNGSELIRALQKSQREEVIPTTLETLDALLAGGLQRGKVVEVVSRRSTGRFAVAMSALAAATSTG